MAIVCGFVFYMIFALSYGFREDTQNIVYIYAHLLAYSEQKDNLRQSTQILCACILDTYLLD